MNRIVSTMKIHNYWIVSTIQIFNKNSLKKNVDYSTDADYNQYNDDYSTDADYNQYNDDYYDDERIECDNCNILYLHKLLHNGLCEMCSIKRKRKLQIFRRKMNK